MIAHNFKDITGQRFGRLVTPNEKCKGVKQMKKWFAELKKEFPIPAWVWILVTLALMLNIIALATAVFRR
jgi:hypothetical protein